uniref:Uncharacterized protein n=1 Tax=Moniliophthora roreri TaxID=221103 RepID=A0A0W0FEK7_MONRR
MKEGRYHGTQSLNALVGVPATKATQVT